MIFLSNNWYFSVQKALIYYTVNKSHHNSFILLVFSHVANFRYVANFTFLTLCVIKIHETEALRECRPPVRQVIVDKWEYTDVLFCIQCPDSVPDHTVKMQWALSWTKTHVMIFFMILDKWS